MYIHNVVHTSLALARARAKAPRFNNTRYWPFGCLWCASTTHIQTTTVGTLCVLPLLLVIYSLLVCRSHIILIDVIHLLYVIVRTRKCKGDSMRLICVNTRLASVCLLQGDNLRTEFKRGLKYHLLETFNDDMDSFSGCCVRVGQTTTTFHSGAAHFILHETFMTSTTSKLIPLHVRNALVYVRRKFINGRHTVIMIMYT